MQHHARHDAVQGAGLDRQRVQLAAPELDVGLVGGAQQPRPRFLQHRLGTVDADQPVTLAEQRLGHVAGAATQVGHRESGRHEVVQRPQPRLAGLEGAGDLVPLARHAVEEVAVFLAARRQDALKADPVGGVFRDAVQFGTERLPQAQDGRRAAVRGLRQAHVGADPGVPLGQQSGLAQDPKVIADTALCHFQGARQLAHGELFLLHQGQDPQASGIREQLEGSGKGGVCDHHDAYNIAS